MLNLKTYFLHAHHLHCIPLPPHVHNFRYKNTARESFSFNFKVSNKFYLQKNRPAKRRKRKFILNILCLINHHSVKWQQQKINDKIYQLKYHKGRVFSGKRESIPSLACLITMFISARSVFISSAILLISCSVGYRFPSVPFYEVKFYVKSVQKITRIWNFRQIVTLFFLYKVNKF